MLRQLLVLCFQVRYKIPFIHSVIDQAVLAAAAATAHGPPDSFPASLRPVLHLPTTAVFSTGSAAQRVSMHGDVVVAKMEGTPGWGC